MENLNPLPDFVVDKELVNDIRQAVLQAQSRQINSITIFASVVGCTTGVAKQAGATVKDVLESIAIAWNSKGE